MTTARRVRPVRNTAATQLGDDVAVPRRAGPGERVVGHTLATLILAVFIAVVVLATVAVDATSDVVVRAVIGADGHRRTYAGRELVRFDGLGPERWARRARTLRRLADARARELAEQAHAVRVLRRQLAGERRVLRHDPTVREAIDLAAATYGNGSTLWRKAGCETGGTYNPRAYNSSTASGLFQFLPSTWASTPYAGFSIWSPYASALAAGWMHAHGRGGEWSCP